jgi:hypothetical protein
MAEMYRKFSCSDLKILGILRKTTMNQSGYWRAKRLLVGHLSKNSGQTDTHRYKTKCVSVWRLTERAPMSSRRQLLLLWCYACSLISIGRRVRSTAQHLDGATSSELDFIRELLAEHKAQSHNWERSFT